jgi:hypothetical protein
MGEEGELAVAAPKPFRAGTVHKLYLEHSEVILLFDEGEDAVEALQQGELAEAPMDRLRIGRKAGAGGLNEEMGKRRAAVRGQPPRQTRSFPEPADLDNQGLPVWLKKQAGFGKLIDGAIVAIYHIGTPEEGKGLTRDRRGASVDVVLHMTYYYFLLRSSWVGRKGGRLLGFTGTGLMECMYQPADENHGRMVDVALNT